MTDKRSGEMNTKVIATSFLIFLFCLSCPAQTKETFSLEGSVRDRATDTDLFDVHVRLLNADDSSLCAETEAERRYFTGTSPDSHEIIRMPNFIFPDIDRSAKYILELTRPNYEPLYMNIDPGTLSKRLNVMKLGSLFMKRQARMLDEVVVKASKVMFYNKGDTIVYNADAFVLAEGSMLDALIRQMPGVELKAGQIYVNGRYVENLMLNGQDFYKGNKQMMLENLGAYTVKDIAVYERQDDMDKIMGNDYGEKHLSMDVRLKKEYNQGLLTNVEAGYGSNERYLGRLFGLWYSDNARISMYGNTNNLSDNRKPGQDTGFTPGTMQSGDYKTFQGGLDYRAKKPFKNISFYGDVVASHQTVDDDRAVFITNFLPNGDTYGYSNAESRNKNLTLSTSHSLEIQKEKWNFRINPSFKYSKNNDADSHSSATFSNEWTDVGKDFIDNLYQGATAEMLASILNRAKDQSSRNVHNIDAGLLSNGKIKMKNDADAMTYLVSGKYKRHHSDRLQRYTLNFGSDPQPAENFDRYFDNTPNYQWTGKGALGYILAIRPGMFLDSWYEYEHNYFHEVSNLYRLEETVGDLGRLPSRARYESAIDPDNSFNSTKTENIHSINFNLSWRMKQGMFLKLKIPVVYRNQHIHYVRGDVNSVFSRNRIFAGNSKLEYEFFVDSHLIYFEYDHAVKSPDLVDMVDFTDALDPLNIRSGNPGLKDSGTHQFFLTYNNSKKKIRQIYRINALMIDDALAYGYSYDATNGVKTGKMYNVNGNLKYGLYQNLWLRFGSREQFIFENRTNLDYQRSVDLISETSPVPERNKVDNPTLSEHLEFRWLFDRNAISLSGEGRLSHFSSRQSNFEAFTARDFSCGLKCNFTLPAGFGLSTDFTVYTRSGYSDSSLNKTNYVWNARASYSVLNGQLIFMADGFDILHNLNNVFYVVNAQARTETYTNVLPRYVMFHVQWKFHKAPKKR